MVEWQKKQVIQVNNEAELIGRIIQSEQKLAEERVEAIQLYAKDLVAAEQAAFIAETARYSNPDYRDVPATSKNKRIAGVAGRLVVETSGFYADMLQDNAVLAALTQLAHHEANLDNIGIGAVTIGLDPSALVDTSICS